MPRRTSASTSAIGAPPSCPGLALPDLALDVTGNRRSLRELPTAQTPVGTRDAGLQHFKAFNRGEVACIPYLLRARGGSAPSPKGSGRDARAPSLGRAS